MKVSKYIVPGRIYFGHDIIEDNGKTVRENNLEKKPNIPLGSFVEIKSEDEDFRWNGCRLYVVDYSRDCDGSVLYTLGPTLSSDPNPRETHSGFGECSLRVIESSK